MHENYNSIAKIIMFKNYNSVAQIKFKNYNSIPKNNVYEL